MKHDIGAWLVATCRFPFTLTGPSQDNSASNKALLIVETRPSYFLPHVVETAVRTHPGWKLYVLGPQSVHDLLGRACTNYELATRVVLPDSMCARFGVGQYSRLMMERDLWDMVTEEHVLVFQSDCVLVRPTPDALLAFDCVGAVCGKADESEFVMNGGLSLRRKSAMLRAIELMGGDPAAYRALPEDVAYCRCMRAHPDKFALPSMRQCLEFAIETYGNPLTAIGMHGTDKYYAPPQLVAQLLAARNTA